MDLLDSKFDDRPGGRFLPAALRVEEGLTEAESLAFDRHDFRAERSSAAVLVHAKLRRREFLLDRESLLGLGNRTLVSRRHASVEVVRYFDRHGRGFFDDVGV